MYHTQLFILDGEYVSCTHLVEASYSRLKRRRGSLSFDSTHTYIHVQWNLINQDASVDASPYDTSQISCHNNATLPLLKNFHPAIVAVAVAFLVITHRTVTYQVSALSQPVFSRLDNPV